MELSSPHIFAPSLRVFTSDNDWDLLNSLGTHHKGIYFRLLRRTEMASGRRWHFGEVINPRGIGWDVWEWCHVSKKDNPPEEHGQKHNSKYNYTSTGTEGNTQVMKHMLFWGGRKNWQEVGLKGRQEAFHEEPFMPCWGVWVLSCGAGESWLPTGYRSGSLALTVCFF